MTPERLAVIRALCVRDSNLPALTLLEYVDELERASFAMQGRIADFLEAAAKKKEIEHECFCIEDLARLAFDVRRGIIP